MDGCEKIDIFISILNEYIYLIINKCPSIDTAKISALIGVVKEQVNEFESESTGVDKDNSINELKEFFRLTLAHISDLQQNDEDDDMAGVFKQIEL